MKSKEFLKNLIMNCTKLLKKNDLQIAFVYAAHWGSHKNEAVIGEKMVVNEQFIKWQTFDHNGRCKHMTVLTNMSPY